MRHAPPLDLAPLDPAHPDRAPSGPLDVDVDVDLDRDAFAGSAGPMHRLVDALGFGVLVLEPCGRVRWANRPARDALREDRALHVEHGRLAPRDPWQRDAFERALLEAAAGVPRMLCLDGGVPTTKLALSTWHVDADGTSLLLATLRSGERTEWPALDAYVRERRLTVGETDVLQRLVLGDGPPEIAARRGSTESTVRSQIKTLLEKTGTHSMRELVVEVLHLPPVPLDPVAGARRPTRAGLPAPRPPASGPRTASRAGRPARPAPIEAPRADRGDRRIVPRGPVPTDRGALLALAARHFAWPPAS